MRGLADDARRNAGHRLVVRDRMQNDRACGDARAMSDLDVAEDLRTRANQYAVPHLRMAIAHFFACAAERHILQHRNVVLDQSGRADHQSSGVIEEQALCK